MSETNLLIGSLSNDLFRVATLHQRGSINAAERFLQEAKRWAEPLTQQPVKKYILNIAKDISNLKAENLTLQKAEQCLMYGVLLQNYAVHNK